VITEAHLGDCLGGVLRPGNVHSAQGIQDLVKTVFDFLPNRQRLRLIADAGFYDGDFIVFLKENHCVFTIVAHLTPPLKARIGGLRYKHVTSEYSCSEFNYQPYNWQAKERFVVLRRKLPDDWQSFTLPTIRHRLLMMPGEFVRSLNIPTLRFPKNSLYQDTFHHAQMKIKKLTPLY